MRVSREEFERWAFALARDILAELPTELRIEAETVVLEIADRAAPHQTPPGMALLGLYEGVPLINRHADSVLLVPDRITLFQEPLQAMARTEVELKYHLRRTLIHELGHFFGFDEEELRERGWG